MRALVDSSLLLALELRGRRVVAIVRGWMRNALLRRVLAVVALLRAWHFVRARRLPQLAAQWLIRWLAAISSLDAPPAAHSQGLLRR